MSETNLINLDVNKIPLQEDVYIADVTSVNDGDTLSVVLSDGSSIEAGDLLPSPAKNLTDVFVDDEGHLKFEMNDGEVTYDAGKLEIDVVNEGDFPSGFGVLSSEGVLKELVAENGNVIFENDKYTVSFNPVTSTIPPITNTINTANLQTFNHTVLADAAVTGSTSLTAEAGEIELGTNVSLSAGSNIFKITSFLKNSSLFSVMVKEAGTETVVKSKEFTVDNDPLQLAQDVEFSLMLTEDKLVDISVRLDAPGTVYLNTAIGQANARYDITVFSLSIVNIKLDSSKLVNYVPPQGQDFSRYTDLDEYLDRLPSDYELTDVDLFNSAGKYTDIYSYNDKLLLVSKYTSTLSLWDTETDECDVIDLKVGGYVRTSYLHRQTDTLWFSTSESGKLLNYNLVSGILETSQYIARSSAVGLRWNYETDLPILINANGYTYLGEPDGTDTDAGYTYNVGVDEFNGVSQLNRIDNELLLANSAKGMLTVRALYHGEFINESPGEIALSVTDGETVHSLSYVQYTPDGDAFSVHTSASFAKEGFVFRTISRRDAYSSAKGLFNPRTTYVFITENPETSRLNYELINKNDKPLDINGISFTAADGTASVNTSPSKLELLTSSEPIFDVSKVKVIDLDDSRMHSTHTPEYLLYENHSLTYDDPSNRYLTASYPRATFEFSEPTELKRLGVTDIPGRYGSKSAKFFSIETSDDGIEWQREEIDYGEYEERSIPEKGIKLFDTPLTCKGFRLTSSKDSVMFIEHFYPLVRINGKVEIYPLEIASTEGNYKVTGTDGTVVSTTELVNTSFHFGITRSFGTGHLPKEEFNSKIYTYFKDTGTVPKYFQYDFPEDVELVGYICNSGALAHVTDAFVESTANGTDWVTVEQIIPSLYGGLIYDAGIGAIFSDFDLIEDELAFLDLKTPKTAKYFRLTASNETYGLTSIERVRVNPLKYDEYDSRIIDVPIDPSGEYNIPLGETLSVNQLILLIKEKHTSARIYIGQFKFITESQNTFSISSYNKVTKDRQTINLPLTFENPEDKAIFFKPITLAAASMGSFGFKDGLPTWIMSYQGHLSKIEGNVVKPSVKLDNTNGVAYQAKDGSPVIFPDSKFAKVIDFDKGMHEPTFGRGRFNHHAGSVTLPFTESFNYTPLTNETFLVAARWKQMFSHDSVGNKLNEINCPRYITDGFFNSFTTDDGTVILLPYRNFELSAIYPVGTELTRPLIVNPIDNAEGFSALPDTWQFPKSFLQVHSPAREMVTPGGVRESILVSDATVAISDLPVYVTDPNNTQLEFVFNFTNPVSFTGIDLAVSVTSGSTYSGSTYITKYQFFTSDDGENWTLLTEYVPTELKSNIRFPRLNFAKVTTKYIKLVGEHAPGDKAYINPGYFSLITDEEIYLTTEFDRVAPYTEGNNYEDFGFSSEAQVLKYKFGFRLTEHLYIIPSKEDANVGKALLLDTRDKSITPHVLFPDGKDSEVTVHVPLSNGNVLVILKDSIAYELRPDLSYTESVIRIPNNLDEAVLGKSGRFHVANVSGARNPLTLNAINLMNSSESYSGPTYTASSKVGAIANNDDVLFFERNDTGKTRFVVSNSDTQILTEQAITPKYRNTIAYASRLPNTDILILPVTVIDGQCDTMVLRGKGAVNEIDPGFKQHFEVGG